MEPTASNPATVRERLARVPLLQTLRERRSRRFGRGMKIPAGPLAYESKHPPQPLTEDEEAALVFAACGITGHALADLAYAKGQGGNIMAGLVARTIASGDGLQTVSSGGDQRLRRRTWCGVRANLPAGGAFAQLIELGRTR